MKFDVKLKKEMQGAYFAFLKQYLEEQEKLCIKSKKHLYFQTTLNYVKQLKKYVKNNNTLKEMVFDRRAIKYLDFVESYRLVKYQYARYSNLRRSLTEGVYSSIILAIVKKYKNKLTEPIKIMDAGCGPSRITFELLEFFDHASIDLYDFSVINLLFSSLLLQKGARVRIPCRELSKFDSKPRNSDVSIMEIKGKKSKAVSLILCDLSEEIPASDAFYDLIIATHSINLLRYPEKTVNDLIKKLKKGGLLVISDLLGWREDREISRRTFYDGQSFYAFFKNMKQISVVDYWYGGPYCEEFNSERLDSYMNHTIILQKLSL